MCVACSKSRENWHYANGPETTERSDSQASWAQAERRITDSIVEMIHSVTQGRYSLLRHTREENTGQPKIPP